MVELSIAQPKSTAGSDLARELFHHSPSSTELTCNCSLSDLRRDARMVPPNAACGASSAGRYGNRVRSAAALTRAPAPQLFAHGEATRRHRPPADTAQLTQTGPQRKFERSKSAKIG